MMADRIVGLVTQMIGELLLQRRLQHPLGQPGQQPVRPDQFGTLTAGARHQTTRDLVFLLFSQPHGRHTVLCH